MQITRRISTFQSEDDKLFFNRRICIYKGIFDLIKAFVFLVLMFVPLASRMDPAFISLFTGFEEINAIFVFVALAMYCFGHGLKGIVLLLSMNTPNEIEIDNCTKYSAGQIIGAKFLHCFLHAGLVCVIIILPYWMDLINDIIIYYPLIFFFSFLCTCSFIEMICEIVLFGNAKEKYGITFTSRVFDTVTKSYLDEQ